MNRSHTRHRWCGLVLLTALGWACGTLDAETDEGLLPDSEADGDLVLPAGMSLEIQTDEEVSTRSTGLGSAISGTLIEPVTLDGVVAIPAGARLFGQVTSIAADPPALDARFERIAVDGASHGVRATLQAEPLIRRSEMRDEAAKIGGGAAAGAVLGGVIGGDAKSAAIGAAAGAAAGTGVAVATKSHWAVLPRGSRVSVRLEEPLRLTARRKGGSGG